MSTSKKGSRNRFYDKTGIARHREWRGLKDTAYDYVQWVVNLGILAQFVAKSPVRIARGLWEYRWFASYLSTLNLLDKATEGLRGPALYCSHELLHGIVRCMTGIIADMMKGDRRFGENDLAGKQVYLEQTMYAEITHGFPGVRGLPMEILQGITGSFMDQTLSPHYQDIMENYGLPADSCRLSSNATAVGIVDDYPHSVACVITNNMPCDSSTMNSQLIVRRLDVPYIPVCMPMRWEDSDTDEYAVKQLKKAIALIEETTGVAFDEKAFLAGMGAHNQEIYNDMEMWEFLKTPYSAAGGLPYGLFHEVYFILSAGSDPKIQKTQKKALRIMERAYKEKINCFPKARHRAIIYGGPPCYYVHFANWLYNCWGIHQVVDMFTFEGNVIINEKDVDEALVGVAHAYERGGMRRHLTGGYEHLLEVWEDADMYGCDMIIFYDDITCKGALGLTGVINDRHKDHPNQHLIWVSHDMFDARTISRNEIRRQVNDYMFSVMREEPLDASLLDFDDSEGW